MARGPVKVWRVRLGDYWLQGNGHIPGGWGQEEFARLMNKGEALFMTAFLTKAGLRVELVGPSDAHVTNAQ